MRALLPFVLGVFLLVGCVSSGEYEKKVSELQKVRPPPYSDIPPALIATGAPPTTRATAA
jgi:hypothetical protein